MSAANPAIWTSRCLLGVGSDCSSGREGSVEDVVTARLVRYMNDTKFGEGKPPEKRFDWTDYGPWK